MAQTLNYTIGADRRAFVKDIQNFKIDFADDNNNWVQARQFERGMRQVFVNILNEDHTPFDMTGCNVWFEGLLPENAKGDFRVIDDTGFVPIDLQNGQFRFDLPGHAFTVAGSYRQAFFRIVKNGQSVTTLEFDLQVLADKVIGGLVPRTYISPLEQILEEVEADFAEHTKKFDDINADFKAKVTSLFDQLSKQGTETANMLTTVQTRLGEIEEKIKAEGLFTQAEAEKLQNDLRKVATAVYPTVADMAKDKDLQVGRLAQTLGYYAPNDGGGNMYRVVEESEEGNLSLVNGLYAQKLSSGDSNYYDEVTVRQERVNHTDVYIATIPPYDSHGELIMPYMAKNGTDVSYDEQGKVIHVPAPDGRDLTPTEYARAENTTLTLNGDASVLVNGQYPDSNIIGNGKVINKRAYKQAMPDNYKYVAIMADRSVREYPGELTTAQQMIDDGVQQAWLVYWPLLKDREIVDFTGFISNEGPEKVTNENVRLGIGVKADKTLIIVATDGRSLQNRGLTSAQLAQVLKDEGCINAWHMDGGGSTSMTYKGTKVNRNIDNGGTTDRHIPYTLNVKRPDAGGAIANAYSQIGAATQAVTRKIGGDLAKIQQGTTPWLGQFVAASDDALDQWLKTDLITQMKRYGLTSGMRAYGRVTTTWGSTVSAMVNRPRPTDWLLEVDFTGAYANGTITMRSINAVDLSRGVRREYHNGELTPWQVFGMATPIDLSTLTIDQSQNIEDPLILRAGFTVTIDFKITPTVTGTWIKLIEGLPRNNHYARPTDYFGTNNATTGRSRAYVDEHGWLLYKVYELDTFDVHLVYITID